MWLMTRLAIIFYVSILWGGSLIVILFVLHTFDIETVKHLLSLVYNDRNLRIISGMIALGIVLVSIMLENIIYGRRKMERTIAFDDAGEVTVSSVALEDLIKSLTTELPQIKDIKPFITVNRKGIDTQIKLTLRSQVNIPDLTARLQDLVRQKIEETIGMEGKVTVRIHVAKIILDESKLKTIAKEPQVPFHGYRT